MVDILDALEPGQPTIVDVVGLVVEDGQLIDFPYDLSQVGFAVSRFAHRLWAEGIQKIVAQVIVFQGWFLNVPQVDPVDVGKHRL